MKFTATDVGAIAVLVVVAAAVHLVAAVDWPWAVCAGALVAAVMRRLAGRGVFRN